MDAEVRAPHTRGPVTPLAPVAWRDRLAQGALTVLPAVLSVLVMVTTHRLRVEVGGVGLPVGLLLGAAVQLATSVLLWALTGSRFPLVVLACLWGMIATPLLGQGPGMDVLAPAVIGDRVQAAGWVLQGLGVGIPFLVAAVLTLRRRRR